MSERPIIFSAPMVRAILAGAKTQTRRLLTAGTAQCSLPLARLDFSDDAKWDAPFVDGAETQYLHVSVKDDDEDERVFRVLPRILAGDTLWVRETWYSPPRPLNDCLGYVADGDHPHGMTYRKRPAIHMPRISARLFLRVTAVRCERLQEITETDVEAEGVEVPRCVKCGYSRADCHTHMDHQLCGDSTPPSAVSEFHKLWDSINAKRAPWTSNPFVWVVEFERLKS